MVEACNGSVMVSNSTKNHLSNKWYQLEYDGLTDDQRSKIQPGLKAYVESTLFLMTAGGHAFHIRKELNNDYIRGNDNLPMDVTSARACVVNYSATAQQQQPPQQHYPPNHDDLAQEGMLLAQNGGKAPIDMSAITCRHPECGQTGHLQNSTACPIRQQEMTKAAKYDKLQEENGNRRRGREGNSN